MSGRRLLPLVVVAAIALASNIVTMSRQEPSRPTPSRSELAVEASAPRLDLRDAGPNLVPEPSPCAGCGFSVKMLVDLGPIETPTGVFHAVNIVVANPTGARARYRLVQLGCSVLQWDGRQTVSPLSGDSPSRENTLTLDRGQVVMWDAPGFFVTSCVRLGRRVSYVGNFLTRLVDQDTASPTGRPLYWRVVIVQDAEAVVVNRAEEIGENEFRDACVNPSIGAPRTSREWTGVPPPKTRRPVRW